MILSTKIHETLSKWLFHDIFSNNKISNWLTLTEEESTTGYETANATQ